MNLVLVVLTCVAGGQTQGPVDKPAARDSVAVSSSSTAESTLKTLHAANIANSTQYRRGQMAVRLRTETCYASKAVIYDMLVRWSGQSVACDYVQREIAKADTEPEWQGAPTPDTPALTRMVTAPGANTTFYRLAGAIAPGSQPQFMFFKAGREGMDLRDFQMRPDQAWFNLDRKIQIRTILEMTLSQSPIKESAIQVDGARVVFGGQDAKEKKSATIEFSLSQGGNAVKHVNWNPTSKRNALGSRGTWSWAQLPDQRWFLKTMESEYWVDELDNPKAKSLYEKNRLQHPEAYDPEWQAKPSWKMRLDVHEFTPDAQWGGDPFDPSRWKVATGTMVEDATGASKIRYRFGETTADPTAEINALVERLKKSKR